MKIRTSKPKKTVGELVTYIIVFMLFLFLSVIYLYCLFWLVMSCFKTHSQIVLDPFSLPKDLSLYTHFVEMFDVFEYADTKMLGMIWNSLWHSGGSTIVYVWTSSSVAYLTCKYRFPGSKLIAPVVMFALIFPLYGSSSATYRLIFELGLDNNYLICLTAAILVSWDFLYFEAFYSNLSWTYAEAAFIDGANDWQVYYRLMLPQSLGIIGTIAVTFFATSWASYTNDILYMNEMPTLSVGIYYFQNEMVYRARKDILYCACLVSLIPILALYAGFSNILFKNLSLGGIKM